MLDLDLTFYVQWSSQSSDASLVSHADSSMETSSVPNAQVSEIIKYHEGWRDINYLIDYQQMSPLQEHAKDAALSHYTPPLCQRSV